MNLHINLHKRKILSALCVLCLLVFCFVIAHQDTVVIDDIVTPLDSGNIEAMFYVQEPSTGNVTCVGDGLINNGAPVSNNRAAVESVIVSSPDYSAYVGDAYEIHWTTIRRKNSEYQVVGTVGDADLVDQKPDYLYSTVSELLNADVTAGMTVYTEGYYAEGDGGASEYLISANAVSGALDNIQLNNGLFAALQIKDSLNVRQLGAVGDGVADDTAKLSKALNTKVSQISFSEGTYLCTQHIKISNSNVSINGNNATIVTDTSFNADYKEWFITISGRNINLTNLNIATIKFRDDVKPKYKTQLGVMYCTGLTMTNCTLTLPKGVGATKHEYSNMDVYTDWHDITIDSCTFNNYSGAYYGGCCGFRDIYRKGCNNARFTNNVCHQEARDEIFAMFSSGDVNTIKDVVVSGNQFISVPCEEYTRHVAIALGYGDGYGSGIDNVLFENNFVRGYSTITFLKTANSTNVRVQNNTFECHLEETNSPSLNIFRGPSDDRNVTISNNNITIVNDGINQLYSLASGTLTLTDNTIDSQLKFKGSVFQKKVTNTNNTFLQQQ